MGRINNPMIIFPEELREWLRLDADTDQLTLEMLIGSATAIIEHEVGATILLPAPVAIKHAVAVFVAAHFDDRAASNDAAMVTIRRLCAPYRVPRL